MFSDDFFKIVCVWAGECYYSLKMIDWNFNLLGIDHRDESIKIEFQSFRLKLIIFRYFESYEGKNWFKKQEELSKVLPYNGPTLIKIKLSDKNNVFKFELEKKRNSHWSQINFCRTWNSICY